MDRWEYDIYRDTDNYASIYGPNKKFHEPQRLRVINADPVGSLLSGTILRLCSSGNRLGLNQGAPRFPAHKPASRASSFDNRLGEKPLTGAPPI
jgi:hypothetical protein